MTYYGLGLAIARQTLALLAPRFPDAVIAGGYFRDIALDRSPKDIDVFIPHQGDRPDEDVEDQLEAQLGFPFAVQFQLQYTEDAEIARVFGQADGCGMPIQVIELMPGLLPKERAGRHDFGLCMAHMGTDGVLVEPAEYLEDLRAVTCTLVNCENEHQHKRSMRRWDRWKEAWAAPFALIDNTPWKDTL